MCSEQNTLIDSSSSENVLYRTSPLWASAPVVTPFAEITPSAAWHGSQHPYARELCVSRLVEQRVQMAPEAVALVMDAQQCSYAELNRRANQLAHTLQSRGVGCNVLVCVCLERSIDLVVGLLAVMKAGGTYVALDPTLPAQRLAFIVRDAQAPVLVTWQQTAQRLALQDVEVICLDRDQERIAQESDANLTSQATADDLAYVVYTSGTTGEPKGVMIAHESLLNLVSWCNRTFQTTPSDRVTQFASPSFDVLAKELWPALVAGASIYIPNDDTRLSPVAMRDWLVSCAVTLTIVPTIFAESLIVMQWPLETSLRFLLTGGDVLNRYPPATLPFVLINNYGPSEATVVATSGQVPVVEHPTVPPSIGCPVDNTQIYILDEQLSLLPVGETGDLYIGGVGLAKGYLNRQELTAERFIPHPLSSDPTAKIYRTGDRARYLPDGQIMFMGRADYQIKILGYRIEPDEIMTVLNQHPAVEASLVVAHEGGSGHKQLVAYVVPVPHAQITPASLRELLEAQLPAYMIPSAFVLLDTFPLTPNRKIDRAALPAPDRTNMLREESHALPITALEERLLGIMAALLKLDAVGVEDNFFALGGNSLRAVELLKCVQETFGVSLTPSTLFKAPSMRQFATCLEQALQEKREEPCSRATVVPLQRGGPKRPFFFLHGDWTGGAYYCYELARGLGEEQPVSTLETYRFGKMERMPTFEEVATAHIKALRAMQPEGPYLLGGFCNGALLAYEMARQLQASGQRVALLALITPSSIYTYRTLAMLVRWLGKLGLNEEKQAHCFLRLRHALRHIYRSLWTADHRLLDFNKLTALDTRLKKMFPVLEALYNDYVGVFAWLSTGYRPACYPDKIMFYWAQDEPCIREEWHRMAITSREQEEGYMLPGTHMTCVTQYTQVLAEHLRKQLQQIQRDLQE